MTLDNSEQLVRSLTAAQHVLYGYILSLLPDPNAAMDVLQEANLVLWRKAAEFDPTRPFMPWACGIAHIQVLSYRRNRALGRKLLFDEDLVHEISQRVEQRLPDQNDRQAALEACMGKLRQADRDLIEERYAEGGSVQVMAERLNKSINAVSRLLYRIRNSLHDCVTQTLAREATE